jgi:hypothetical protein
MLLTLLQSRNAYWVKVGGVWKITALWVKVNGTWRRAVPFVKVGGTWIGG